MKLTVLFSILISSHCLIAQELSNIEISRTFSVNIPFQLSTKVEMPSLNSKLLRLKELSGRSESQILIVHNSPQTIANKFSVQRYWAKSRKQTKSYDKKENDIGCQKNTARSYQCSRDVSQNGKFISESIFWNAKNDLVLIRVSSPTSFSDSRKLLTKIKIAQTSRLPAGSGDSQ